jgi:thiol-disulfide isomerase/thioredoxin
MRDILLPLAVLGLLAGCQKGAPERNAASAQLPVQPRKIDRSHAGQPLPTTAFQGAHGKPQTLAAFRGKPLLLNFWATWCAPCVKEMPSLDRLAAAQKGKLEVVALSQDSGRDRIDAFFAKAKIGSLAPDLDDGNAVMAAAKVEVLPTTILFDAGGREVWRVSADRDWQSAESSALVAEAFR